MSSGQNQNFERVLAEKGILVYGIRGISMQPMLRQERDTVVIRPANGRLRRYDVALYRYPSGKYVLHRVIRAYPDGRYLIRGDNLYKDETTIRDENILGVLDAVIREGKTVSAHALRYKVYERVWVWSYPLRKAFRTVKGFLTEGLWVHLRMQRKKKGQ